MSEPGDGAAEKLRPHLIREPRVISPPDNFGVVEAGLYRSSLPQAPNFSHLRGLHLRSVVVLSQERPTRTALNFFEAQGITVFHTGAKAWMRSGSWKPISDEVVKESLQIVLRRDNLPALVCDVGGLHLVGMVVGCLRRLQHWNVNSAVDEYRAYAGSKTRYNNEQFIELYDVDLVTIPDHPPLWFAEQVRREKEERREFRELLEQGSLDEEGCHEYKHCNRVRSTYMSTMKVLSDPDGDGLLTNAEVMHWLREKKANAPEEGKVAEGQLRPPPNAVGISNELLTYFEKCPSGNQTVASVGKLFEKLSKFNLSSPELLMIANIRPEAYAHITPLIIDIHNRFDEDQVYEMLEAVKKTLEPRPQRESEADDAADAEGNGVPGQEIDDSDDAKPNDVVEDTERLSIDTMGMASDSAAMED